MRCRPWKVFWELLLQSCKLIGLQNPAPSLQRARALREEAQLLCEVESWRRTHGPGVYEVWSAQERHVLEWLLYCSWARCNLCGVLYQRTLTQAELNEPLGSRPKLSRRCYQCLQHPGRFPENLSVMEWPAELVGLSDWNVPFQLCSGSRVGHSHDSVKNEFVSKLCSGVPDYCANYELLQFQFDRYVLRLVSNRARQSDKQRFDTHLSLQHQHWTPGYWLRQHRILEDLVEQLGYPDLFLTISPYEWMFPYPYWIRKVHDMLNKGPTDAAGPEVLAVAHALHQLCRGLLAGQTNGVWKTHVFGDKTGGKAGVKAFFGRYEFQEGGADQVYGRGRGSLHLHCLFWFDNVRDLLLDMALCGHLPPDDAELSAVASRVLRGDQCRAPVSETSSSWMWSSLLGKWMLNLHVSAAFMAASLRPFIRCILRVLRCAQDVQWWHAEGALLRYVAGYVSKHAEHWNGDWLSEATSPLSAGLNVCRWWRPCEAEMVMTLARESMVLISCDHKDYRPPAFGQPEDAVLRLYRQRSLDQEHLTCLQWYRLHTVTGNDKAGNTKPKLRQHKCLMAVGVWYYDFPKDQFFWQYLIMNFSHRLFSELLPSDCFKVSPSHRNFAAALLLMPDRWGSDLWLRTYLQRRGHREDWIRTQACGIAARRELVSLQIAGVVPKWSCASMALSSGEGTLSDVQLKFLQLVFADLQLRVEATETGAILEVQRNWKPRFVSGGPGSGKTFCTAAIISKACREGFRVLVVSPTGQLSCSVAQTENVQSMTLHRAFGIGFGAKQDRTKFLSQFAIWILAEVGMVAKDDFDHIWHSWRALLQTPVFVIEGDLGQLAPPASGGVDQDVRHSAWWPLVREYKLYSQFRCCDPELLRFQVTVRHDFPTDADVATFFAETNVGDQVSEAVMTKLWDELPNCFVLCATRAAVDSVNSIGLQYFGAEWLGEVPVWTSCLESPTVTTQHLRLGSKIMITRNSNLQLGLANGAYGTVLRLTAAGVVVQLGERIECLHCRSAWIGNRLHVAFDLSLGYACTVHKAEGATLDTCAIVFERFSPPGWGYTAVTRVRAKAHLRTIGFPSSWHFTPRKLH